MVRQTAANQHTGQRTLVSRTRTRQIDERIGGVLLGAYDQLRRQLRHIAKPHAWLTERGHELVRELRAALGNRKIQDACLSRRPIRYTPISESYRPAVELSLGILGGRPFISSAEGSKEVFGVLLDMAEVWELYLFHLLRDALADKEVVHTGRLPEAVCWLLVGKGEDRVGAMKPDILLSSPGGARRLILDAKYKFTTPGPGRREGVLREDLYQMAAYLSVAANSGGVLDGALSYPASEAVTSLEHRGPFHLSRSGARFYFLGLACDETNDSVAISPTERAFAEQLRAALAECPSRYPLASSNLRR